MRKYSFTHVGSVGNGFFLYKKQIKSIKEDKALSVFLPD